MIETLYENEWVSLKRAVDPAKGIKGYVFSHEKRCNGEIIAILPYRYSEDAEDGVQFLLRKEVTPCWSMKQEISSLTGGMEPQLLHSALATKELWEEAGYAIHVDKLVSLGTCRGTKSCDTVYHLFTVDLSEVKRTGKGEGDGSELEKKAHCYWTDNIDEAVDPMVYVMYHRMLEIDKAKKEKEEEQCS